MAKLKVFQKGTTFGIGTSPNTVADYKFSTREEAEEALEKSPPETNKPEKRAKPPAPKKKPAASKGKKKLSADQRLDNIVARLARHGFHEVDQPE